MHNEIKTFGEYHDLYVQSDILFLADVFDNSQNIYFEIYELDPAHFVSAPGLVLQAVFKKTKLKLGPLTDIGMFLMVGKGIRGGICHAVYGIVKANNKYMKDFDKKGVILSEVLGCK